MDIEQDIADSREADALLQDPDFQALQFELRQVEEERDRAIDQRDLHIQIAKQLIAERDDALRQLGEVEAENERLTLQLEAMRLEHENLRAWVNEVERS